MKRLLIHSIILSLAIVSLDSCGGAGARAGAKAAQQLVKSFSKNAGKNSQHLLKYRGTQTAIAQNGRLVPLNQLNKYNKIAVPNPKNIGITRSLGSVEASPAAQSSVKNTEIDLLLYDAVGNPIVYASEAQHSVVYSAAQSMYQGRVTPIVDDILLNVQIGKVTSDAELKRIISTAVNRHLGSASARNPFIMDVSTGNLTLNMEFLSGSQIVGSINLYDAIKKSVAIGGAGYYVVKRLQ